jgi:hypothetical protein
MPYTLTLRETKGEALTFTELDQNFELLYSGSQNGTYVEYTSSQSNTVRSLIPGQGFGNILVGTATTGITASQIVIISDDRNDKLDITPANISQYGTLLGVALQTVNSASNIQVLTEGYYAVLPSASGQFNNYFKEGTTVGGTPIYFSGSFVTTTKPNNSSITRPLGFVLNTEVNNSGVKYVKFFPSVTTLA